MNGRKATLMFRKRNVWISTPEVEVELSRHSTFFPLLIIRTEALRNATQYNKVDMNSKQNLTAKKSFSDTLAVLLLNI